VLFAAVRRFIVESSLCSSRKLALAFTTTMLLTAVKRLIEEAPVPVGGWL
jgi:hypothetical protein